MLHGEKKRLPGAGESCAYRATAKRRSPSARAAASVLADAPPGAAEVRAKPSTSRPLLTARVPFTRGIVQEFRVASRRTVRGQMFHLIGGPHWCLRRAMHAPEPHPSWAGQPLSDANHSTQTAAGRLDLDTLLVPGRSGLRRQSQSSGNFPPLSGRRGRQLQAQISLRPLSPQRLCGREPCVHTRTSR